MEIFVCFGPDCRGSRAAHGALRAALGEVGEVRAVGCQKICSGPVAGVEVDGRLEWFERLRGPKSRRALVRLAVSGDRMSGRLRKRRVGKRAGHLRGRSSSRG